MRGTLEQVSDNPTAEGSDVDCCVRQGDTAGPAFPPFTSEVARARMELSQSPTRRLNEEA